MHLEPSDPYRLGLYLRVALIPVAVQAGFALIALGIMPLAMIWHISPVFVRRALWHHGRAYALLIGLLAHMGFYYLPLVYLFLAGLSLLLFFPRYYFWNRRAARLRRDTPAEQAAVAEGVTDATVWPPPPRQQSRAG